MASRNSFIVMVTKNMNQDNVQEQAFFAFILVLTGTYIIIATLSQFES